MPIFDFLRGEFIDVIAWTDDTRDTIVARFERAGPRDQVRRQADGARGAGGGLRARGPARRHLRPRALRARDQQPARSSPRCSTGTTASRARSSVGDLLRQHPPLHRPEVGDAEPDHLPRQGLRHGAAARLRHLHHARRRPGEVPGRDRRHRRRVHHRGDRVPDPQPHRHPLQPDHRHLGHPGARHGGQHPRPRQDRARAHRAHGRRVRPRAPRLLRSRTSRSRPRSRRRSTSAPPPASRATSRATPSSPPPRR